MIELSNLTAQTVQPGQTITFDKVHLYTGRAECYNSQVPNSVKLKCQGIYEIEFSGNIAANAATTPIQLSLAAGGFPLVETVMNATPAAAGDVVNVSTGTYFKQCCDDSSRITVINSGTAPLVISPNSNLRIRRIA